MEQSERDQDLLIADLDQENRLMRARNERLEAELSQTRNLVLEEVAQEMEKFKFAFGVDTVGSFTAFVRAMKDENRPST